MKLFHRVGDLRIRKLHGSWCVQKFNEHHVLSPLGHTEIFKAWELISTHDTHKEAIDSLYAVDDDPNHHLEACS